MISKIFMGRIFILILAVGLSVGQGFFGSYYEDCTPNYRLCSSNPQCCSGYCVGYRCGPCKLMGEPCTYNSHCCDDKTCWLLHCNNCRETGQTCVINSDCCANHYCYFFTCRAA